METLGGHFRHILLYYFRKGKNAVQPRENFYDVYGEKSFARFRSGDFNLKDEKWVVYDNVVRKRSWSKRDKSAQSTSKADIHQNKVMLSVWWDFKSIVYFELLPRNQTINSNVHCRQLMKLDKEFKEKRPELATRKGVIFHQDNSRPHTSLVTRKKLLELGWEVMPHPPYSPDLA